MVSGVLCESFLSKDDAKTRERRLKQDGRARYQLFKRIDQFACWSKIGAAERALEDYQVDRPGV